MLLLAAAFGYVTLTSNAGGITNDATGSTGGTVGCGGTGSCHNTAATAGVAISILLDSAGTVVYHYQPGMTYRIKVTGVNATTATLPKFGYQLAAFKGAAGSGALQAGTFTNLPASSMANTFGALTVLGNTAPINSTGTGATGDLDTFSVGWIAPAAGTGTVNMYAVICAADGNATEGPEDKWNKGTNSFTELPPSTGIKELPTAVVTAVFPNPAGAVLHVQLGSVTASETSVALFDLSGRQVHGITVAAGEKEILMDTKQLVAGMYTLVVTGGGKAFTCSVLHQ